MDNNRLSYLILGAGPTGLGAAHRLLELGIKDFLILEKNSHAGGLSASFQDAQGFTWDIGGHVVFSHYPYFDALLHGLLGPEHLEHQRKAMIRIARTWAPYPFQNNIRYLPPDLQWACIEGLLGQSGGQNSGHAPANFRDWILHVFGPGIADLFMFPYNFKVWAHPLEIMDWRWIGERVSVVDVRRVLKNIVFNQDDVSWGPNNVFRFPLFGGTGEIFRRLAAKFEEHIAYNSAVTHIDPRSRQVRCTNGRILGYERLLNTGPLDRLILDGLDGVPDSVITAARDLKHNGVHILGVGLEETRKDDTCWMYFPENSCPFYRVTNFHNYSPNNTAKPGTQRALMAEVSFSAHKPESLPSLTEETIAGLINTTLMSEADRRRIASTWEMSVDYGYPIPCLHRDMALRTIQPWLESNAIYSRGRFGGWKYEVGNMDHCLMQGVEWAERMVLGQEEKTYSWARKP